MANLLMSDKRQRHLKLFEVGSIPTAPRQVRLKCCERCMTRILVMTKLSVSRNVSECGVDAEAHGAISAKNLYG